MGPPADSKREKADKRSDKKERKERKEGERSERSERSEKTKKIKKEKRKFEGESLEARSTVLQELIQNHKKTGGQQVQLHKRHY